MILAEDSLVALNQELPTPMEMERFRPNIVVSGLKAFEEVSLSTNNFQRKKIKDVVINGMLRLKQVNKEKT